MPCRRNEVRWLGEALAASSFHLLLRGCPGDWGAGQFAVVRDASPARWASDI
jgi:hypothetical protein